MSVVSPISLLVFSPLEGECDSSFSLLSILAELAEANQMNVFDQKKDEGKKDHSQRKIQVGKKVQSRPTNIDRL